ncbi:MAG: DNA mismatch repair protein MutS, partial [Terriglobales bacterium]
LPPAAGLGIGEAASGGPALTPLEDWIFDADFARRELETHFGLLGLEGLGLGGHPWATAAAAAIVHYVKETQRSRLDHVNGLGFYSTRQGLVLDAATIRNLELIEPIFAGEETATLRHALDQTLTPMGRRLLRAWILAPLTDRDALEARLDAVAALAGMAAPGPSRAEGQAPPGGMGPELAAVRSALAGILDLERLLSRAALATANPRDLVALAASLERIPQVAVALHGGSSAGIAAAGRLAPLAAALDPLPELRAAIAATLAAEPPATTADGGYIRAGFSAELDELRALGHGSKQALAQLEQRERQATGIASLKVRFNNIFGYYIEVSRPNLPLVPPHFERKQTLVNAERFTLPELKDLEQKVLTAQERALELEAQLFA